MSNKKQHGGDWIDKIQAHNRNVYLESQAEAAKEKARQAKLDRLQNEEHRRQMREIEQKKADDEAARLQLAREERVQKDRAKHENEKIYNLSRRLKELKDAETTGKKFLLICELQKEAQSIDLNAVLDLAYKDRFSETEDAIDTALSDLFAECGDNAVYLKAYAAAMKNSSVISSLYEIEKISRVLEAEKLFPELLTENARKYNELVNNFRQCASKAKSIFEILKTKTPELCHDKLKEVIAAKACVPDSIFTEEGYDSLEIVPTENEDLIFVKEGMLRIILDDPIPSEELQPLFDFLAERSSTEKIVVETYRREKALEKSHWILQKKKEQKELSEMRSICKVITASVICKFDIPDEDDGENPVVAKVVWHKDVRTTYDDIVFYRDHVCWLTENKVSLSATWDDLVNSWARDYRKGGFLSFDEFRGHKFDKKCVELFERLIAYKQPLINQQEKSAMPPAGASISDKESSADPPEKNVSKKIRTTKQPTVKEAWQGTGGCGCMSVIIGFFFPAAWPYLIALLIIFLIYAIVTTFRVAVQKKDTPSGKTGVEPATETENDHISNDTAKK